MLDEMHGTEPLRAPVEMMGFSEAVARYCAAEP